MRAILDTNVIVDVLQQREPWFQDGVVILCAIANKQVTGCLTAKQIADLHSFSRKQFKGEEKDDARARQVIGKLLALFEMIDTLAIDCQNPLGINNGDYEDAILIESAARAGVDCIATRNPAHYRGRSSGCTLLISLSPPSASRNKRFPRRSHVLRRGFVY